MKTASSISKHPSFIIGVLTAIAMIAYFLIMKSLGYGHIVELRLFNFVLLFGGIAWTMREHARATEEHYNYFNTLGKGCSMVIIAVGLFSIFIFGYLEYDTHMLYLLKQTSLMGNFLTPYTAAVCIFGEGASSGFIVAYILLSYMKNQRQTT